MTVEAADPPGAALAEDVRALAVRAGLSEVFAFSDSSLDVGIGVARCLVAHLADWCLVAPRVGSAADAPLVLVSRPSRRLESFDSVEAVDIEPRGIGTFLPAARTVWGSDDSLTLRVDHSVLEVPAGPFGVLRLGGPRLRFGSLVLARASAGTGFSGEERGLVEEVIAQTSAVLERAELAQSALRAARARDTVVDVVSHDLGTPLNSVSLLLERIALAAAGAENEERIHRYLAASQRSLGQVERLLSDLSDIRDIEQGMFSADLSTQPVCEILAAGITRVERLARDQNVRLELLGGACPLKVMADPARVVQLLVKLIGNAIQVSPRGGVVRIVPRRAGDRAEISIVDQGPGIPPERLPHIFDRFARARGHDGARRGLGLMIAQAIARAHGDGIRVETEVGRGSSFTFSLSLSAENGVDPRSIKRAPAVG
jgi:signal transduction histidine kinase